jgi:Domain of unknown function DUF11/Prealbumin-like fold domain
VDRRRARRLRLGALIVGVLVLVVLTALSLATARRSALAATTANETKVRICHRTASHDNPYVPQEPAISNNGDLSGSHLNHTGPIYTRGAEDWGDIIPPYSYVDANGEVQVFPGSNWSPEGQSIWQNGCGLAPAAKPIDPIVECVEPTGGGGFLAHFGYDNPNATPTPVDPADNTFTPASANGGQPSVFDPGRVIDAFQVESSGGSMTWHLTGNDAVASSGSTRCQASITIVKELLPASDPGRFALEIDGRAAGGATAVGDGGTTGTIAVDAGVHTVGESAAPKTSLAGYTIGISCTVNGQTVAHATSRKLGVRVRSGQALVCTITNTRRTNPLLSPVLECVVFQSGVPSSAVWGYRFDNAYAVRVPIGKGNGFSPGAVDRGQPEVFAAGRVVGAFETPLDGPAALVWTLAGNAATASAASPRCTATLELRKVTVPAGDPGRFDLLVNGHVVATGGNGTTSGPLVVGTGEGTVAERGANGTSLSDYDSSVACTRNGAPALSVPGTKVDGAIAQGEVVVCTFTNTRRSTPRPPGPPTPPGPPPLADLSIEKTASPTSVLLGQRITWSMTVRNKSSAGAADVNVVKVNEGPRRVRLLSLTPSQGTCGGNACDLGRLAPGASATITAVTRATHVGTVVDVVRVGSEEEESDYTNNTASAIARVTARGIAGAAGARSACRTLTVLPVALHARATGVLLVTTRSRFGRTQRGVRIQLAGAGIGRSAVTDARGVARFTLTPLEVGVVLVRGRPAPFARRACTSLIGVLPARATRVTG